MVGQVNNATQQAVVNPFQQRQEPAQQTEKTNRQPEEKKAQSGAEPVRSGRIEPKSDSSTNVRSASNDSSSRTQQRGSLVDVTV